MGGSHIAAELTRILGESRPTGLVSAYLFGSAADGRSHRESDVDLGVLFDRARLPTAANRFTARLDLAAMLAGGLRRDDLDLVVLNDAPPLLGRRIVREGTRLYCASLELDHAFVRDVQLRAADIEPFLRRMRRLTLDTLTR